MRNFGHEMGGVSINFELKSTPTKRGTHVVMLRITENQHHKRCCTDVEVPRKADWDQKRQMVRSTAPYADRLNADLAEIKRKAIEIYRAQKDEGMVSGASIIRELQRTSEQHTLLDFCRERVAELESLRQFGNAKKYGDTVNKLTAFAESRQETDVLLSELDIRWVDDFVAYLKTLPNQRFKDGSMGLSENTIVKHKKILRAILNNARSKGYIKENPLDGIETKEAVKITRHLSDEELHKLKAAQFAPGTGLDNGRNLYLFSMYAAGMRLGDVLMLRWNNIISIRGEARLQYTMSKTGKSVDLILVDEARDILNQYRTKDSKETDYVFPYLDATADFARYKDYCSVMQMPKELHKKLFTAVNAKEVVVNKQLKKVADMLGIEPFSFHSARRDFGRLAYDAGVKSLQIQDLLCHENIATTERYMRRLDCSATDNALEQVFSQDNKERRAKVLVRELKSLGYGKADVKRLFDEIDKKNQSHRKTGNGGQNGIGGN